MSVQCIPQLASTRRHSLVTDLLVRETLPVPAARDRVDDGGKLVRVEALRVSYPRRAVVLDGIDLEFRQGERIALIGANGSGKSTLLRCLVGLLPFSSGRIELFGQAFSQRPNPALRSIIRRNTGFIFQRLGLVGRRTALSNVTHGLFGEPGSWRGFSHSTAPMEWRNRALAALASVNLEAMARHRVDRLSGGQQQRVAIARAIVRQPSLLIADEPAASLDPVSGLEAMRLFSNLSRDHNITLLFTSHDMAHARDFSDRVLALKHGRILFDRPTAKVNTNDLAMLYDHD